MRTGTLTSFLRVVVSYLAKFYIFRGGKFSACCICLFLFMDCVSRQARLMVLPVTVVGCIICTLPILLLYPNAGCTFYHPSYIKLTSTNWHAHPQSRILSLE